MYTKQTVNHTIQHSITYILTWTTLHSTSFHLYTLHIPPNLNSLHFTAFTWTSPPSKIPFTSLNTFLTFSLTLFYCLALQIPFTSLHVTYYISLPFPGNTRFPPHFKFPSLHFTYHIPGNTRFLRHFKFPSLHFPSLHFTYHFPTPLPEGGPFRGESP